MNEGSNINLKKIDKKFLRLMIGVLVENGYSCEEICYNLLCDRSTVMRWKKRNDISEIPRSGRPLIYGKEERLRLIGFYCQTKPLKRYGRWSLRDCASYLAANPDAIGFAPSKSTIFRILQTHKLKPHRNKYFLHITDPDFFQKMENVLSVYRENPINLFCFDESPGLQVLQRLVPAIKTKEMQICLEEFEYIRNGAIDLFACLEVSTGRVFAECYSSHTTENLVDFMEKQFLTVPENEPIHYILDNLNTHYSYEICKLVAHYSKVECPAKKELNTTQERRDWLSKREKRIVFYFTPFHGSWLNMVEIWFGILKKKCLNESFTEPDEMYKTVMTFTNEIWNNLLAHPFTWEYNGEGLHEKTVRKFTQILTPDNIAKTDLRILTKQMYLVKNLFFQYKNLISDNVWEFFINTFKNTIDFFKIKIQNETGPQRKEKASTILNELTTIFI